jgi:CxxC-x17-CxxC domain-containing protein
MFKDKNLVCRDCGTAFVFTTAEQEFYAEKGLTNDPVRCPDCRKAKKMQSGGGQERRMYEAVCSSCGRNCQVPFQPTGDKPVYCRECYQSTRS